MKTKYGLPSMEHRFSIQVKGDETHLNWVGEFLYRRPTIGERGQIARHSATLNGDLVTINPIMADLHGALAHLRYTLREMPEWWTEAKYGAALFDVNVVMEVYDQAAKFEADWRKKVLGGDSKDVEIQNAPDTQSVGSSVGATA